MIPESRESILQERSVIRRKVDVDGRLGRVSVTKDEERVLYDTRCYFNERSKADISQLNTARRRLNCDKVMQI